MNKEVTMTPPILSINNKIIYFFVLMMPISNVVLELLGLSNNIISNWQVLLISIIFILNVKNIFLKIIHFNFFIVITTFYILFIFFLGLFTSSIDIILIMYPIYLLYPILTISFVSLSDYINKDIILKVLLFSLTVLVVGGIIELLNPELVRNFTNNIESERMGSARLNFGVGSSLVYGPIVSVYVTILTAYLFFGSNKKAKIISLMLLIVGIITLYSSFTRIAWIQYGISLLLLLTILIKSSLNKLTYLKVYLFLIISTFILVSTTYFLISFYDFIINGIFQRNGIWNNSLQVFLENPILGKGIGDFTWATRAVRNSNVVSESYLLQLGAEMGIVPVVLFMVIYIYIVFSLFLKLKRINTRLTWIDISIFVVLVSFTVSFLGSQAINAFILNFIFWLFIGLGYVSIKKD